MKGRERSYKTELSYEQGEYSIYEQPWLRLSAYRLSLTNLCDRHTKNKCLVTSKACVKRLLNIDKTKILKGHIFQKL